MSERIPQSVSYLVVFRAFLASDGKTPATGKTIAITISKNGATSFSNPNAGATNATEMASGFYKFTLDTTDTGTLGPLAWRGAHADINDAGDVISVVKSTNAGFSALPDAAAEAAGGLYTRGTGAGQINQAANGMIDTNPVRLNNVSQSLLDLKDFADDGYDPSTNKVQGVVLTDTVTTYTGNTPQTGDSFARLGAPAGASVSADIAAIEAQTDDIGAAGVGLSAIPWNSAWDAEVQSEVEDALVAHRLDELLNADSDIDGAAPPTVGSVFHELMSKTAGSFTFDQTTDSHEAIRDNMGTAQTGDSFARLGAPAGASVSADIAAIEAQTDDIGVAGAGLSAIPWNAAWDAEVQSEVQDAIEANHLDHLLAVTYDPASKPGAADALLNELVESDAGVARYTANALEQAPTGGSAPTAAQIADAVWEEAIADHSGTAGSTAEQLAAAGASGDPWATALPGSYTSGQAGKIVGDNLNATVGSRATQTSVDDLPTNAELATALAAADDAVLAAIAALNNLSQANIRTAIGLGSANLDTQLGDLPTNAELTTALAAADDAVLAAIAALNNLSIADVRAAVGLASANLDTQLDALPTNAELATALGTADDAVLAAIAALNNLSAAQVNAQADLAIADAALATAAALSTAQTAITAIKAKTDSLTFTVAGTVDANLQRLNDTEVLGNGTSGSPWRPA